MSIENSKNKKRGQGEGTISKHSDGKWWARITIGYDKNGKQKRKAFYGRTRKEVQEKMTEAVNDLNKGHLAHNYLYCNYLKSLSLLKVALNRKVSNAHQ